MAHTDSEILINAWSKRKGHQRLRRVLRKVLHLILTFVFGVVLATVYHQFVTNTQVRKTAEAVCENFGRDEQECKDGIDNLLDESDNEVDNNINIDWLDWPRNSYGTIRMVERGE